MAAYGDLSLVKIQLQISAIQFEWQPMVKIQLQINYMISRIHILEMNKS